MAQPMPERSLDRASSSDEQTLLKIFDHSDDRGAASNAEPRVEQAQNGVVLDERADRLRFEVCEFR